MTKGKTMEDRQVSLKQMLDTVDEMPVMKDNNGMEFIEKSLVKTRLWLLPSAEPEQKTGKWIKTITSIEKDEKDGDRFSYIGITPYWYCSECGTKYEPALANTVIKYCYNCGARMVGEGE